MHNLMKILLLTIIFVLAVQNSFAQKYLEKPWEQWNKEDALKILSSSPWAYNFAGLEVNHGFNSINNITGSAPPPVILRLYSSQTIRRALLRLRQIDAKYETLNEQQKAQFDQKNASFLNCEECKKYYVLILLQPVDQQSKSLVAVKFRELKFDDLKESLFLLNDKKEKRSLAQYIAPKTDRDPAIFLFSRLDEAQKPLITKENKKLTLNFKTTVRNDAIQEKFDFNVPKMIVDNEVDF
jgi:hypothetical protein